MAQIHDKLLDVLASAPDGLSRQELLRILRELNPTLSPQQLDRVIQGAGDRVVERDNRLRVARPADALAPDPVPPMASVAIKSSYQNR